MEQAWKAAWYILDLLSAKPKIKETQHPTIYPVDPEAEYERLYRAGEMEIVVEPLPWETEDTWTEGYIEMRQELLMFDPYLKEENKNGTT